ncbi:MAG: succinate--CoA ligase subunit beta [Bacteroidetes bacterium RIFOXYA12_FULL_35_11]|nr:MAG: succinate--CoA ligase subunit beta [Bacteroidetes bacterium GWF2_35_48]OFY73343.1 MAG: succinate--CoA ligase subunit beta [Bacteroidetes bacterium RIFOXYA12_FULL_35_11]OFY93694.1 MAG: succinate--CoA ligase subunit beta [Bacteroidetes bacterium RIFOXYC12_FULL_35_7]HBX52257.1 ADP-forming succinate--CoA ligase subunit beta [Bacteroidales bacterium]
MNIHEYQAKALLKNYGVYVPEGFVADTPEAAIQAAMLVKDKTGIDNWAVKAQIHAGGRGKGGGVKIAKNIEEVQKYAKDILGMNLVTHQTGPQGKKVHKILIEQSIYFPGPSPVKEYYMSILLNRQTGRNIVMYSTEGGMDIEAVAEKTPHLIFTEEIHPGVGIQPFQTKRIAFNLGLEGKAFKQMTKFVEALCTAFEESYATLIEINPVFKTSNDVIIAADAKIALDDNALFKHPEYANLRDFHEEDPTEVEASQQNLNFIKLDGNVGCMVNGAGLAMATMDIIKLSGGEPANFLDVGGSANATTVEAGFKIILKDPKVKAILVNIFGGIVRCDRVASGIVEAYKNVGEIKIPIIVRLQGTNAEKGKKIIDNSGLKVYSAITLQEAADLVKKVVK